MRAKVTASRLNVRAQPDASADKLGILAQDAIVNIISKNEDWCEIRFANRPAFISQRFVQPLNPTSLLKARVNTPHLNVRDRPSMNSVVLGSVRQNTFLDVVSQTSDWLEVLFNQQQAYISAKYAVLQEADLPALGGVNVTKLNVRDKPTVQSRILGTLGMGTQVSLRGTMGNWYEILFNGVKAYISAKYISTLTTNEVVTPIAANEIDSDSENQKLDIQTISLEPEDKLDVIGSNKSRKVASTWNRYGNLLATLGEQYQIEPACAIAVLCVESSGDGFRENNQGRMVIRFENHKFWSYWGKQHSETFHQFFKLDLANKPWLGHKWRASPDDPWTSFHGNQQREWQVLEFARRLDDTAALKSISMGAPQIMGFNYEQLDYPNVQTMFDKFTSSMRYQILGLFQFLTPAMLRALRQYDFAKFAGYYNGSGQKEQYGQWIDEHFQAFKNLTRQ